MLNSSCFRAEREQLKMCKGLLPESNGQTFLHGPNLIDSSSSLNATHGACLTVSAYFPMEPAFETTDTHWLCIRSILDQHSCGPRFVFNPTMTGVHRRTACHLLNTWSNTSSVFNRLNGSRMNMAHERQSRPDYVVGYQVKTLNTN